MDKINKNHIVTAICPNCGVGLTCSAIAPATKCHWCHTLIPASLYVENPNMPEQILPFKLDKDEVKTIIDNYISKRKKYSTKEFISNYNSDNIVPVYLPYMIVDINLHSENKGQIINSKLYDSATKKEYVERNFNMTIENALVESSKSNYFNSINSTSNVISSVVPYDIENAVEFNTNYLNGYLSENRELNIELLKPQLTKIAENNTKNFLDSEMKDYFNKNNIMSQDTYWYQQKNTILGSQWSSILLPVWIYSYSEKVDGINKIYYIAVNGRTGKIVGSIPMNNKKLKNLKVCINTIFYPLLLLLIYLYYQKFIYTDQILYTAVQDNQIIMAYFLLIILIPTILGLKVFLTKKLFNGIKNKYIYNKENTNTTSAKVVVYNIDYKEKHNLRGV